MTNCNDCWHEAVCDISKRLTWAIAAGQEDCTNFVDSAEAAKLKAASMTYQWTSVKDHLPEYDGRYLVFKYYYGTGWIDVASFAKDGRKVNEYDFQDNWENVWYDYDSEYGYCSTQYVTNWMPLPAFPTKI